MAQFPSLPQNPHLSDLLKRFPKRVKLLMDYSNAVLRDEGALTLGEREMVAAYVSGLNACKFCHDSHVVYAEAFGIDRALIEAALDDPDGLAVPEKLRPLLTYVAKVNNLPSKLTQADSDAVLAAGWSEEALFEAIEVAGLFNLYNRLVEGGGVTFDYAAAPTANLDPAALAHSYTSFGEKITQMAKE